MGKNVVRLPTTVTLSTTMAIKMPKRKAFRLGDGFKLVTGDTGADGSFSNWEPCLFSSQAVIKAGKEARKLHSSPRVTMIRRIKKGPIPIPIVPPSMKMDMINVLFWPLIEAVSAAPSGWKEDTPSPPKIRRRIKKE